MKNIILSFACLVVCSIVNIPLIYAQDKEAGEAARLTSTVATFSAEPKTQDIRVQKLQAYMNKYKSPLAPYAHIFIEEADKHDVDWRLVASIAGLESTFGRFIPRDSYNAWGWGVFTGQSYGVNFKSWDNGIATVTEGLKKNYLDDGLTTVEAIGYRYAASPTWAYRINYFMNQIDLITPSDLSEKAIAMTL